MLRLFLEHEMIISAIHFVWIKEQIVLYARMTIVEVHSRKFVKGEFLVLWSFIYLIDLFL